MSTTVTSTHPRIESILRRSGTVATVVVPEPEASEDLAHRLEIMTKSVRRSLEAAGAPSPVIERVEQALVDRDPSDWTGGLGVVADSTGVTVQALVEPRSALTGAGPLPRLLPFVHDIFEHRPHVVARCDRTGADVAAVVRGQILADVEIEGDDQHVQKVSQGGWSQARLQRHSEHTWEQNAKAIVDGLVETAESIDAELIVATGDVRAVQLVAQHLPEEWQDRLATDDFEPTDADTDAEVFHRSAVLVHDRAASEVVDLLERFAEARGRDEAADSVDEVFAALRRGAVDTLLVSEDVEDLVAMSASDRMQIAAENSVLEDIGLDDVEDVRLTDAAIVAALAGGASVVIVPEHGPNSPTGPVGALLRY